METRRTIILGLTIFLAGIALCGASLWLVFSPEQYQATARIRVENDVTDIPDSPLLFASYGDPFFASLIMKKIQSPTVLSNVVSALNLNVVWGKKHGDGSPLQTAKAIKCLQRRMNLEPIRNTRHIKISFSSEDPNEAVQVADAIGKGYADWRFSSRRELTTNGLRVLTEQFPKEESEIKIKQEKFEQLRHQLKVPTPEPPNELLKSNYPSYFQAKQDLQSKSNLHELLATKIEAEKADLSLPRFSMVQIVEPAQAPRSPVGPNRILGAVLLVIGLVSSICGALLLKSSRRPTP